MIEEATLAWGSSPLDCPFGFYVFHQLDLFNELNQVCLLNNFVYLNSELLIDERLVFLFAPHI